MARSIAGDQNAIGISRGGKLEAVTTWRSADTMEVVGYVVKEAALRGPKVIRVDVGRPGAGVCDRLRELGYAVEEVYFGGGARDSQRFENRRAELYWNLRERLERGDMVLPEDDELLSDLAGIRHYFAQDGRIQLESKDETRKRLGRSPDRADAVTLAAPLDQAGQALNEWRADLHVIDEFMIPPSWDYFAGLSYRYRAEGGIFIVFAIGPDGDVVAVKELPLYQRTPYDSGWEIAQLCKA